MKFTQTAAIVLAVFVGPACAEAATSCVATATAIQSALTVAENNSQDDAIEIVGGSYLLAAGLTFNSAEAHLLDISGGWNAGCTQQINADTTLDGQNSVPPLILYNANGPVHVSHLTFASGKTTASLQAPIQISSNSQPVSIEMNSFIGNKGTNGIGALTASTGFYGMVIRNNLFIGNHGALGGALFASMTAGEGFVIGNTMVGNIADADGSSGGLGIGGAAHFYISNNILWNNNSITGTFDFKANVDHSRYHNDIGAVGSGTAPAEVVAEQYVDPQFAPCPGFVCFIFELSPTSPLVDAGDDIAPGGITQTDLAGKPRRLGAHVDIGAYENEVIFVDGFE